MIVICIRLHDIIYLLVIEQTGMIIYQILFYILFFAEKNVSEKILYKKTIKT